MHECHKTLNGDNSAIKLGQSFHNKTEQNGCFYLRNNRTVSPRHECRHYKISLVMNILKLQTVCKIT